MYSYGTAMIQILSARDFAFMREKRMRQFNFMSVAIDSSTGYILEVDLIYDESLHHLHSDHPLCPENAFIVSEDMLPCTKQLAAKLDVSIVSAKKLNLQPEKQNLICCTLQKFIIIRRAGSSHI